MNEATILLNNTNAQALSNRDPNQISELQIKLANFKQAEMPIQKERVNNMVTLSVQLYGENYRKNIKNVYFYKDCCKIHNMDVEFHLNKYI